MSLDSLNILTISREAETSKLLEKQLMKLSNVGHVESVNNLSDAEESFMALKPTVLIVDLTGHEADACEFIELINFKQSLHNRVIIFGIHEELNPSTIIKAVSSGVKEFIQYPANETALEAAIQKHLEVLKRYQLETANEAAAAPPEEEVAQVISVYSAKGGSGATTVAANLAYELSQLHGEGSTILIDLDQSFCNISGIINVKANYSLSEIEYESPDDFDPKLVDKITIKHESGIHFIFSSKSILEEHEPLPESLIGQTIEYLRGKYKYIILDLPSRTIDNYHQVAVMESNRIMVVAALDIQTLHRTRQYLELVKQHIDPAKLHLVVNRHDLKGCIGLSSQEIEAQFKHAVFHRLPNSWGVVVEAVSVGNFISQTDETNPFSKALNQLAVMVSGKIQPQSGKVQEKGVSNLLNLIKRNKVCHS